MAYLKFSMPFLFSWNGPASITNFLSECVAHVHKSQTTLLTETEHYWQDKVISSVNVWLSLCTIGHCHPTHLSHLSHCSWPGVDSLSSLLSSAPRPLPHSSWHWPPLKPTLGPTQDREPNSSSENFTLITSLDNFIPCIVSHFYVDNLIDETRSIKSWKFKLTIIFRIPHWSHDAASTLEQGEALVKMSRKLIDESFYLIWDGIPILLSVEN